MDIYFINLLFAKRKLCEEKFEVLNNTIYHPFCDAIWSNS